MFIPLIDNEVKDVIRTSNEYTTSNFIDEYQERFWALERLYAACKVYIVDNYEKVKDWSGYSVSRYEDGKYVRYGKVGEGDSLLRKRISEMTKEEVRTITDVYLDIDGDFTFKVNDNEDHFMIDGEDVVLLASYIQEQVTGELNVKKRKKKNDKEDDS